MVNILRRNSEINYPEYSIYSTKYKMKLIGLIKFELTSLYGRLFMNKKPPIIDPNNNLLHLGCADKLLRGWVNADFFKGVKFWKYIKKPNWMLDLRFPLNCEDDYWDGVFTEHTLEHLSPQQVLNLLKEILRTLKSGCWLRISVPNLKKYIDYYCGKTYHEKFNQWSTGAEAIWSLTQNLGHFSVWDGNLLGRFLHEAGFADVKEVSFLEGTDKRIMKDNRDRSWESLYMEAKKTQRVLKE